MAQRDRVAHIVNKAPAHFVLIAGHKAVKAARHDGGIGALVLAAANFPIDSPVTVTVIVHLGALVAIITTATVCTRAICFVFLRFSAMGL